MENRKLTGKWYIQKKWFGFVIMVECIISYNDNTLDYSPSPEVYRYLKATPADLIELDIHIH